MTARFLAGLFGLLLMLLAGLPGPARADTASNSQTVHDVVIYMGLLPEEIIRGHPRDHPETTMHGGRPPGSGGYHLVIALFDAKSGARITNADIAARVGEIGLAGDEKKLEPMEIAGSETYGNYFRMAGNGPFRISLAIRVPGEPQEMKAVFEHRHQ